jgi:hypothetical protein
VGEETEQGALQGRTRLSTTVWDLTCGIRVIGHVPDSDIGTVVEEKSRHGREG